MKRRKSNEQWKTQRTSKSKSSTTRNISLFIKRENLFKRKRPNSINRLQFYAKKYSYVSLPTFGSEFIITKANTQTNQFRPQQGKTYFSEFISFFDFLILIHLKIWRKLHKERLLRTIIVKWHHEIRLDRNEWRQTIKADCQYRYVLSNKIWQCWKQYTAMSKEENQLLNRAVLHRKNLI